MTGVIGVCRDFTHLRQLQDTSNSLLIQAQLQSQRYQSLSKIIGQINQCLELDTLLQKWKKLNLSLFKRISLRFYLR
ncbi:hypothetical protein NO758_02134 [Planktothrix agardhii]|uniref:Uncharacterized protein n=1 Tax=Planktothrix rubescens CCAP 1459/22 TaxID=329571 RepID=A0A6J7ZHF4_PLARU|nr:hypothetical protein PLAN_100441 [Planktothrix rubescens NIVA-CYA 18]CAD0228214.1 conserved hypothetical protein [Planktothrix agardhii]CAD5944586.1 hypothetical protein NO758_02134 [Planktothrix agardhii]CAH2572568.1 hypothetical protein PRNO82_01973 [Planktothrix rubescens]